MIWGGLVVSGIGAKLRMILVARPKKIIVALVIQTHTFLAINLYRVAVLAVS